jgi:hypothetical protein
MPIKMMLGLRPFVKAIYVIPWTTDTPHPQPLSFSRRGESEGDEKRNRLQSFLLLEKEKGDDGGVCDFGNAGMRFLTP